METFSHGSELAEELHRQMATTSRVCVYAPKGVCGVFQGDR